jgi:serine protease AprX
MNKTVFLLLVGCFLLGTSTRGQATRHIIQLKNKAATSYQLSQPQQFMTARALARRARYNISIDSTDLPIPAAYLDSIRNAGVVTILNTSRWLNTVAIQTSDINALNTINAFSFVQATTAAGARNATVEVSNKFSLEETITEIETGETPQNDLANIYNYGQAYTQVHLNQGEFLHNYGFSGQGMQVAVLDAGFRNYETLITFDSLRLNGQLLGNWDFVTNTPLPPSTGSISSHGTHCLSTMAANLPGTFVGTAPKTSFYLYRTEDPTPETPIEEQNLAAALERADSLGVDMASISLGYTSFDAPYPSHTYADMNGNITAAARAADLGARKGMLIVCANGNDGASAWHYLGTPADADSVLAVGAVNAASAVAAFSSYGPSSDGQIKPDVAAMGVNVTVANASTGLPGFNSGTSFATPITAGLTSCLWQAFPEANNMGIITALREAATIYTTPDDRIGYGIPSMKKAFVILLKRSYTQQIQQAGCSTRINWSAKSSANMSFEVQRKLPADADFVSIQTITGTGAFVQNNHSYLDDLSTIAVPSTIQYRIKMNMDTDTSFYFPTVTINHNTPCNTYSFIGNGNWDIASNWLGNNIPPAVLPQGSTIIIDPAGTGECILNINQQISAGALLDLRPGKKLRIPGNLVIQ